MMAELSAMMAAALRTTCGTPIATPTGGLRRRSSSIARSSDPGSLKISPASRLGVIIEFAPSLEYVASSRWLTEEPSS